MTTKEFSQRKEKTDQPLIEAFGATLFFLISDVINVSHMQQEMEDLGYKVKRRTVGSLTPVGDVYFNGEKIALIKSMGTYPQITFFKKCRSHARKAAKSKLAIKPIEEIHTVLAWHDVKDKLHCLAGGETIVHFMPQEITVARGEKFLKEVGLYGKIATFKKHDKDTTETLQSL